MDKTCECRCHCFAIPNPDKHKKESPLSYEPTSAVELYSQTFKTNSKQCTRSVTVGLFVTRSGQETRCRAEISKFSGDHVILLLPVS